MAKPVELNDADTSLADLIERAVAGEEVIIAKGGKPIALLVPLHVRERVPGRGKNTMRISPDFDSPLPEKALRGFGTGN